MKIKETVISCLCVSVLSGLPSSSELLSQDVIKHRDENRSLSQRYEWAVKEVRRSNVRAGFWIGYSIEKLMGENSFIGSISKSSGEDRSPDADRISLQEMITGEKPAFRPPGRSDEESLRAAVEAALSVVDKKDSPRKQVLKQVAVLFGYEAGDPGLDKIDHIRLSNLSLASDLKSRPLFWLGKTRQEESIEFLEEFFKRSESVKIRKRLVSAMSHHSDTERTLPIVTEIALNDPEAFVRKEAVYGVSRFSSRRDARLTLERIAFDDAEVGVQKEAVYRISRWRDPVGQLINLGKNHHNKSVRKEAIYRLSQQTASEEAVQALEEMIFDDPDVGVQKEALYRISQLPESESRLIGVARSHDKVSVRKEAIYRLAHGKPSVNAIHALEEFAFNDPEISVQKEAVYRISHAPEGLSRLVKIAQEHENSSVRKEAMYRLAQNKTSEKTVDALEAITFDDPDVGVQKEAVYRIAQLSTHDGNQLLIHIAKTHSDRSVRKEAIYRLVATASKKSVATLASITFEDSDTAIQKEALQAISRLDNNAGIPLLIEIATTHRNPKIRKAAIYRLGQSEDKKAIEALEKIVLEK